LRERRFAREAELIELVLINFAHLYSSPKMTESRSVPAARRRHWTNSVSSELQFIGPILEKQIIEGPWNAAAEHYRPSFVVSLAGLGNPTFEIKSSNCRGCVQKCERKKIIPQFTPITQISLKETYSCTTKVNRRNLRNLWIRSLRRVRSVGF